jgi:hypothetical protein
MQKLLSQLYFGLGDDSWFNDKSHIFEILHYRDIFKCIQFLLAHLPFQTHLDFEPVRLAHCEGHQIYSEMNTANWWWDTQDQHPAGATIVPVICASNNTQWTNFSGDQLAGPLCHTICNIGKVVHRIPKTRAWLLVGLMPCPRQVPRTFTMRGIPRLELCCRS